MGHPNKRNKCIVLIYSGLCPTMPPQNSELACLLIPPPPPPSKEKLICPQFLPQEKQQQKTNGAWTHYCIDRRKRLIIDRLRLHRLGRYFI